MKSLTSAFGQRLALVGLFSVCGCSTLIGADFDREPYPIDDEVGPGVGGVSSTGGAPGSGGLATGGSATGGFATGVGGSSVGGTGGNGVGGSATTGGSASGGGDTGGSASGGTGTGGSDSPLRLNEIYPNGPDYIEVYNSSNQDTSIAGFRIVEGDLSGAYYPLVAIKDGTMVTGGGYYVFDVDFGLAKDTTYFLVDDLGREVDRVDYPGVGAGFGYAAVPNGGDEWFELGYSRGESNQNLP